VQVYFEVEPTLPVPEKYFGLTATKDYELLTLVFQQKEDQEEDFLKAKLEFVKKHSAQGKDIEKIYKKRKGEETQEQLHSLLDNQIKAIFRGKSKGLLKNFEQKPMSRIYGKSDEALEDLKNMLLYSIEHGENFSVYISSLNTIIHDHFFQSDEPFLHLKRNIFKRLLIDIGEAGRIAFSKGQDDYFDQIISLFYRINFRRALPTKNDFVYREIIETFNNLHEYFTMYRTESYSSCMATIILNLSEWIHFDFQRQFEEENDPEKLELFYKPVILCAISESTMIIRRTIDRYNFGIESHQFNYLKTYSEDFVKLLDLYHTEPYEYMKNWDKFYDIKSKLKKGKINNEDEKEFDLANAKAYIVREAKKRLQKALFAIAAYIVFKVEMREVPSDLVWKIAMRMANVYGSREKDLWSENTQKILNEYPMLREYESWFDIDKLYQAGYTAPESWSLKTFWILFDVYRRFKGQKSIIQYMRDRDKYSIQNAIDTFTKEPKCSFWSEALNMPQKDFIKQMEIIKSNFQKD